jgi:[acyl-carrier-protein] S-malonyltransferase
LIFLFSGQGLQTLAHRDEILSEGTPALHRALDAELAQAGTALATLDERRLHDNAVAQVLIWGLQWLRWKALAPHLPRPVLLAGYSAGETAAYTAAGLWPEGRGAFLAGARARLMSEASARLGAPAGMMAVSGCDTDLLTQQASGLAVHVAIRVAEQQLLLGGLRADLDTLANRLSACSGAHLSLLAVHVPAHTPLLQSVQQPWHALLQAEPGGAPQIPLLCGSRASVLHERDVALAALAEQVSTPILWEDCLNMIAEYQPDALLELGPGAALAKMALNHGIACPVRAVDEFRSHGAVLDWLSGLRP